ALRKALDPIPVMETSEVGLDVDAKEAIAFAVLAYETSHSRPSNVPMATGAKRPVILGKMTPNTPAPVRNGSANGPTPINGAARSGAAAMAGVHKAKATRNPKVTRTNLTPKVKAAAR
ncbi:MAG: anhydro-N-acetylmuramic acid kinase, partial [Acidobacteriaceae bacterium]|nr:anhydro-N-acetylmuramic acid kinase [Acidobacteriaceae bacterium]